MNRQQIIVATTTLYESVEETRFKLAMESIRRIKDNGYRMVIIDGSCSEVREIFRGLGIKIISQRESGMGSSRRQLFGSAYSKTNPGDVIFWMEPEKIDIVRFIPKIVEPIFEGWCNISIPVRTEKSWQTYPKFQRYSEQVANRIFQEVTRLRADIMFGPMALSRSVLPEFSGCHPLKYGIGDNYVQHVATIVAFKKGAIVLSPGVEVDFEYPPEQLEEGNGPLFRQMVEKRLWQLGELVDADLKLAKIPIPDL